MARNLIIDIQRTEFSPTEPCTLAQAKTQAIVTYTDDDTLITSLIKTARKAIENYCNVSMVAKTIIMTADLYNEYELPYGPVTGILGVQTRTGTEGSGPASYATQTSGWGVDGTEFMTFKPSIVGGFNINIPYTGYDNPPCWANRYRITYTAGPYTPDDLVQAVLVQIVFLYERRGEEVEGTICDEARILAEPYKRTLWQ